jgi:hypothetical protein
VYYHEVCPTTSEQQPNGARSAEQAWQFSQEERAADETHHRRQLFRAVKEDREWASMSAQADARGLLEAQAQLAHDRQAHIDAASARAATARDRTRSLVCRARAGEAALAEAAAASERAKVNWWEQERRREGVVRRAQGKRAIAWGGTEAADEQAQKQEERAERTSVARARSKSRVVAQYLLEDEARWAATARAKTLVRTFEQARIAAAPARLQQGRDALNWGGTDAARKKKAYEEARAEKTVVARGKSFSNAAALKQKRISDEDAAAADRRACVNGWEQTRAREGWARLQQGRDALNWGGTDAARKKKAYEDARAEKTRVAREASLKGATDVRENYELSRLKHIKPHCATHKRGLEVAKRYLKLEKRVSRQLFCNPPGGGRYTPLQHCI